MTASPGSRAHELVGVIQHLSTATELDAVTAVVRRAVRRLLGADGATFVLRDGDRCYYADEDAIAPLWKGQRFPMSACISGWVMREGQSVVIEDVYADPRIPVDAYRATFVKSLAMVPVRREHPVAAIGAYFASRHRTPDDDVATLQTLADSAALALQNVQLYGALRAALDEAQAANRAKDEFLSMVSHELRTPLNAIYGWVKMLRGGQLDEPVRARGLEVIERNALSQIELVNDLLELSRIVSGRVTLEMGPVDVAGLVRSVVAAARAHAEAKELALDVSIGDDLQPIQGDEARLRQVVANLVSNAIKFTPAKGRVQLRLERAADRLRLTVADTGVGIRPEVLPHVFDRLRQGDSSRTRAHGGLGLGLALVRHFVELHRGSVRAASDGEGRGATFIVELP